MNDMTESEFSLNIEEADLNLFVRVYRALKDSFRSRTRLVLLHIEDDIWEVRIIGLTSREWLEYCANIYAELPSETVNLAEEVQEYSPSDPVGTNVGEEGMGEPSADYLGEEEAEAPEEDSEEEEENADGESPAEEIERKLSTGPQLRKAKLVRRTGSPAVTVETD